MFFPKAESFLGLIGFGKSQTSRYELADRRLSPGQVSYENGNVVMKSHWCHLCPAPLFQSLFSFS